MPRRVNLPSADDLFPSAEHPAGPSPAASAKRAVRAVPDPVQQKPESMATRPSGRVKHDEKVTVYVTAQELYAIEHARLELRSAHGLAVDRGRLLREALSLVLADLDAQGADSALVRRLLQG